MMASAVRNAFGCGWTCSGGVLCANDTEAASKNPATKSIRMAHFSCRLLRIRGGKRCTKEESGRNSAVLAIEQIAHGLAPSLVRFLLRLALVGVHAAFGGGFGGFRLATRRAAIGKTGFARLQFELFPAHGADFNRESHPAN